MVRAEALKNASFGNLTPQDKQQIMSSKVVEEEPCCAKKQPANNSPSKVLQTLGNTSEPLNQRMKIKA